MSPFMGVAGLGGAASLISIKAPGNFWYLKVNTRDSTYNGRYDENYQCPAIDSSGNVYVSGTYYQTGFIAKFDSKGIHQWTRELSFKDMNAVAVDSSGNVYGTGTDIYTGAYAAVLVKLNSSGTLQWQRKYDNSSYQEMGFGVDVDNSGGVYMSVESYGQGSHLVKYDTSGTFSWNRKVTCESTSTAYGADVSVDKGNQQVYLAALDYTSASLIPTGAWSIHKFNTSGTHSYSRIYGTGQYDGANTSRGHQIRTAHGVSGDWYISGTLTNTVAGGNELFAAKFNASGTLQWSRRIGGTATDYTAGMAVDDDGNVYACGMDNQGTAAGQKLIIAKWNDSGVLQWQRELGGSAGYEYNFGNAITVDNDGSYYLTFYSNSPQTSEGGSVINDTIIFKLPDDGTLTGTHGDFTYAVGSFTESNVTDASVVNVNSPSVTNSPSGWSSGTPSYTSTTVTTEVIKTAVS